MKINLRDVKTITNRLLDHLIETRGLEQVEVEKSFYWSVPAEDRYEVEKDPGQLDVGDVRDDWEFVSTLLDDENQPVAYQLTELAPVLQCLGELLGEQLAKEGG